ncbi:MAG: ABC transporter substrate-binding protein [Methanothrix sp.]|nr:ABC transporter substrate-binding protein [Methanothrix sp.]
MRLSLVVILLVFIGSFFANSYAEEVTSVSLTDDMGRMVTVSEAPARIISLSPSNTEILFALGLQDRVIGVTKYCNYPPEIEELKKSGKIVEIGGYKDPDIEKIISLNPDLVLASKIQSSSTIPDLENAGISTFAVNSDNLSHVLQSIKNIGKITRKEEKAAELVESLESRIKTLSEKVDLLQKKRVLYVFIFHDLSEYPLIDPESVALKNPEIIITGVGSGERKDDPLNWARTEDGIEDTDARKDNRIYQVQGDILTRAGPRIVDALEMIAKIIHPEAFLSILSVCHHLLSWGAR